MATENGSVEASQTKLTEKKEEQENQYGLPQGLLNSGFELYNGVRLARSLVHADTKGFIESLRNMSMREDDVLVAAYPKSGTHWTWEVVQMLVNLSNKYSARTKVHTMMEFCTIESMVAEPSPRILNSHLWMAHLPKEIVTKKPKIIHVVRNPKDTIVSFYYHIQQMNQTSFTFDALFKAYIQEGVLRMDHQLNYLRQMTEFQKAHPDVPVKLIYYEEMKKNPVKITKEIAEFLNVQATDDMCEEVALACSFDKMKTMDVGREHPEHVHKMLKQMMGEKRDRLEIFRKGTVGDWKNHFTVAQNEIFDDFLARQMAKGLDYKFIYE